MELRQLRYFLMICEEKSITKAAERLYITQPSLSKQMQNLEGELGCQLFVRGSRNIELTEKGKILALRASELLELEAKTEKELLSQEGDIEGEITIGGGESASIKTLAEAARILKEKHPHVTFSLHSGDSSYVLDKLDKGLLDFGVVLDRNDFQHYGFLHLPLHDRWGVLVKREDPLAEAEYVTAEQLKSRPLITSLQSLNKGNPIYAFFGGKLAGLKIVAKYNLLYNATLLVKEGFGIAIGLEGIVKPDDELAFTPLYPLTENRLDLIYRDEKSLSQAAKAYLDIVKTLG